MSEVPLYPQPPDHAQAVGDPRDDLGYGPLGSGGVISFIVIGFITWGPITPVIGLISFVPKLIQFRAETDN